MFTYLSGTGIRAGGHGKIGAVLYTGHMYVPSCVITLLYSRFIELPCLEVVQMKLLNKQVSTV